MKDSMNNNTLHDNFTPSATLPVSHSSPPPLSGVSKPENKGGTAPLGGALANDVTKTTTHVPNVNNNARSDSGRSAPPTSKGDAGSGHGLAGDAGPGQGFAKVVRFIREQTSEHPLRTAAFAAAAIFLLTRKSMRGLLGSGASVAAMAGVRYLLAS